MYRKIYLLFYYVRERLYFFPCSLLVLDALDHFTLRIGSDYCLIDRINYMHTVKCVYILALLLYVNICHHFRMLEEYYVMHSER